MSNTHYGMAALIGATGLSVLLMAAPIAAADTCDPAVTVCQGNEVQNGPESNAAPTVSTSDEQYPYDGEWYFNPEGGGTALQPNHASGSGGGGSSGGGGGHR
jgi:uncharacterized membrane protein YgcG